MPLTGEQQLYLSHPPWSMDERTLPLHCSTYWQVRGKQGVGICSQIVESPLVPPQPDLIHVNMSRKATFPIQTLLIVPFPLNEIILHFTIKTSDKCSKVIKNIECVLYPFLMDVNFVALHFQQYQILIYLFWLRLSSWSPCRHKCDTATAAGVFFPVI